MAKKYTVGSLFAGIGGICQGFKDAGFKPVWANEWDKNACLTYRANFRHKLIEGDVHGIKDPKKELGAADVITSGFPCQAFSVAGYRLGFKDPRGNLFFETARIIDSLQPKAFLLENVKNLAGHDNGRTLRVIQETIINELGYSCIPFILNSKDFGVPQTRERIYVVGFKGEADIEHFVEETLFTYYNQRQKACTSHFVIPVQVKKGKQISQVLESAEQEEKFYYRDNHRYYAKLSSEMSRRDTIYQWRRTYVRENKSKLCPTLTANMGTGGHNVPLVIDDFGIRKLTPMECLGFQGYPKSFVFPREMALSHCYKQAGNSVVVPVIELIARAIKEALDKKYSK